MQGAQVRSLVGELRFHMLHQGTKIPLLSAAKKKKKKKVDLKRSGPLSLLQSHAAEALTETSQLGQGRSSS